jgi:hypothetical protein
VFDPLIGAAIAKNNEHVYGRPQESFGGTLLSRTSGLSAVDRGLAASRPGRRRSSSPVRRRQRPAREPPTCRCSCRGASLALPGGRNS